MTIGTVEELRIAKLLRVLQPMVMQIKRAVPRPATPRVAMVAIARLWGGLTVLVSA